MKKLLYLCVVTLAVYNSSVNAKNSSSNEQVTLKQFKGEKHGHSFRQKHHKRKLDRKLRAIIKKESLTGNPLKNRMDPIPDIRSPVALLGMDLFFSKTLGGDHDSACVTCHHPILGGGDNLSLPIGVGAEDPDFLGPGRTIVDSNNEFSGPPVPRNAPTTFNVIAWDQFLFHDGRVESLDKIPGANGEGESGIRTPDSESSTVADLDAGKNLVQAQARFPVTSPEEMKGFNHSGYSNQGTREMLAERLNKDNSWVDKFSYVFGEGAITEQKVAFALGEYERSQVFIDTPWRQYVEGDNKAISNAAKKGALIFYRSSKKGGANCSSCHSGDFFTDEGFHNLAMPQIGPGKENGEEGSKDFGRARETDEALDMFAFRTPSLINVEVTGPWSHAGAYTSLEAVIKHHLNTAEAIENYDYSQLSQENISNQGLMVENTAEALEASSFDMENINLSDKKIGYLVEFLKSLTDPCTKKPDCLSEWIPDSDPFYFNYPIED